MSILATGNAIEAMLDAVRDRLRSDATLRGSVTGIYEQMPKAARTAFPYVCLSSPMLDSKDFGAMGTSGGRITFAVDAWSEVRPHVANDIMAQIKVLLMRVDVIVAGHRLAGGSLTTVDERGAFSEPDADMPERELWHAHQTWEGLIEES